MKAKRVTINRAPVLTLWATVVAERLGYDRDEALTLGKAVAVLNAQSKGQRIGIYEKPKDKPLKIQRKAKKKEKETITSLMGRAIPVVTSAKGMRASMRGEIITPESVQKYLAQKFGDDLGAVQEAMQTLAKAFKPEKLAGEAYALYEKFRPSVPEGQKGWGAKGELDLALLLSLTKKV